MRGVIGFTFVAAMIAGCGGEGAARGGAATGDEPLLVLAAANLVAPFEVLEPAYESAVGEKVTFVFGSSGNLAAQIRNGAPADVYVSANEGFLDGLVSDGLIDPATRVEVAVGRLAVVVPPGRDVPPGLGNLSDLAYDVVAIANPEHAPYGVAARSALQAVGVWSTLGDRLVLGENVAQTFQYVRTGNADVGLVALSLVVPGDASGPALPYRVVDAGLHPPILQVAGVVRASPSASRAADFLAWLTGPDGRAILRRFGFEPPES